MSLKRRRGGRGVSLGDDSDDRMARIRRDRVDGGQFSIDDRKCPW